MTRTQLLSPGWCSLYSVHPIIYIYIYISSNTLVKNISRFLNIIRMRLWQRNYLENFPKKVRLHQLPPVIFGNPRQLLRQWAGTHGMIIHIFPNPVPVKNFPYPAPPPPPGRYRGGGRGLCGPHTMPRWFRKFPCTGGGGYHLFKYPTRR
jgi:hypothetical protein